MSAIAKVASLWDIELGAPERAREEESPAASPFAARCYVSVDGQAAVPLTAVELDLARVAELFALVNFEAFLRFAQQNNKWQLPTRSQLSALVHGLAYVFEHGVPSVRDTKELAAWRKSQPRLRRRVLRAARHRTKALRERER